MHKSNPYLFLNSFTAKNARLFFGRDRQVRQLAGLLDAHRHVALFGPVGAGKTSLVQAGLTTYGSQHGVHVYTLWMIRNQVCQVHAPDGAARLPLVDWAQWLARHAPFERPTVVVFDQLDRFFQTVSPAQIEALAAELAQALVDYPTLQIVWVVRERNLFYLDLFSPMLPDVLSARYHLDHLHPKQAGQIIVELAKHAGVRYTDELVAALLSDLAFESGKIAAPRLQVVCWALYQGLTGGETVVDLAAYRQLGGANAILTSYLDDLLAELPDEEEQDLARALLKEMVDLVDPGAAWDLCVPRERDLRRLTGNAPQRLDQLYHFWQARGIVREVPEGYTLAHAFLVNRVSEWAQQDKWATKDVRDLLRRSLLAYWRTGKLIDKQGLGRLRQNYARMRFSDQERALILRSALAQGYQWRFWVDYAAGSDISVWDIVREALKSQDAHSRSSAVTALSALSGPQVVSLLSSALTDAYPNVRGLARSALARLNTAEALQALRQTPPPEMVLVPGGTFVMGSDRAPDEQPARLVYLDAFYIDRFPVTNAEYAKFIRDTGYPPPANWEQYGNVLPPGRGDHPVSHVCWFDARDYAAWAGKRLPTEAEWEKAARGPDGRQYPWGDQFNSLCCNTDESEFWDTTAVDAFVPQGQSPYGVADMSGNVWEWVADWYDREYYRVAPERNPPGPVTGTTKVVRGGAWEFSANESRCSTRNHEYPGPRHGLIGFRCAADPEPGEV